MENLDIREWLLSNGLGSFASGTVSDIRTRTYHGWLFAATNPPTKRQLLLSHLEASLEISGQVVTLGTNFWADGQIEPQGYKLLRCFEVNPIPKWIWGRENWELSRRLIMPNERNNSSFCNPLLIQYCYEGISPAILKLRLLIADRSFHHQQRANPQLQFSQLLANKQIYLQSITKEGFGTPWYLRWNHGEYQPDGIWYWNYGLPEETERGLKDCEDLYSPGYFYIKLQPGDKVILEAGTGFPESPLPPLTMDTLVIAIEREEERLAQIFGWWNGSSSSREKDESNLSIPMSKSAIWQSLLRASDRFIVHRASIIGPTVIAGYHWFNDWGRDTLIALPGLTLVTKRFELAKGILHTFGSYCRDGLIPNTFPDDDHLPIYNSIDAALWWIEILGLYLEATKDWDFLAAQYPVVQQIYKALIVGTRYNIQADSIDGLLGWEANGVAITWMDVVIAGKPVTPRCGKPVEVNALWYSALCWISQWSEILSSMGYGEPARLTKQAQRYAQQAEQVKTSLQKFWNPQIGYLYDTIEPDDRRNTQVRPNAVLALSLHHCGFPTHQGQQILARARATLLTPYGLRSLDPSDPEYIGMCTGNVEQRDSAYHQGTVWCWLLGAFIRSWQRFYPQQPVPFDWEPLLEHFLNHSCMGSISEIFDGDPPHKARGAIAQAWSVAEVLRHFND
ncbi:amylo-alpha-1,6-glucosidase [Calothrix rhizosoleniae]|uniref:amylo-alpha-1,6-glucosidase n=1 Tax=Calothrix rhizosoleniae TaxID=888997 RepID=UPI000B49B0BD|nr:amylo-alpha-1,6-glucosidase [Calothrix rhizosoleniae]